MQNLLEEENDMKKATLFDFNRMCSSYPDCEGCPLEYTSLCRSIGSIGATTIDKINEINSAVVDWCEKHKQKTYADDFFEKFPRARKASASCIPIMCMHHVYPDSITKFGAYCPDGGCKECWNKIMEDENERN